MFNDTINLIKILFTEIFNLFDTIFERFKDIFYYTIDYIFNGKNYRYFISFILVLIGILIYFLLYNNVLFDFDKEEELEKIDSQMKGLKNKNKNLFNNKIKEIYESISNNTKNANILFIVFSGILLSLFYFFVYRNDSSFDYLNKKELKTNFTGRGFEKNIKLFWSRINNRKKKKKEKKEIDKVIIKFPYTQIKPDKLEVSPLEETLAKAYQNYAVNMARNNPGAHQYNKALDPHQDYHMQKNLTESIKKLLYKNP